MMRFAILLHALKDDESGAALVELALFSTIMMVLTVPTFDLVNTINENLKLTSAMRAGVMYAYRAPTDTDGIEEALQSASQLDGGTVTVANYTFCECGGTLVECTVNCVGTKAKYMSLTANYSVPLAGYYPQVGDMYVLSKSTTFRIQ